MPLTAARKCPKSTAPGNQSIGHPILPPTAYRFLSVLRAAPRWAALLAFVAALSAGAMQPQAAAMLLAESAKLQSGAAVPLDPDELRQPLHPPAVLAEEQGRQGTGNAPDDGGPPVPPFLRQAGYEITPPTGGRDVRTAGGAAHRALCRQGPQAIRAPPPLPLN